MTCENEYTLPTIKFIGGSTRELSFNLYYKDGTQITMSGDENADFSVAGFAVRSRSPLIQKAMTVVAGTNIVSIALEPNDTITMGGKYIYQIQIDSDGEMVGPLQGTMYIGRNINSGFTDALS